jgi:signal transduction histidine kinase/CheY-like chemotaxis protein
MWGFRDASIKKKITVVVMLTSAVALLVASALFAANDVYTLRRAKVLDLTTLAEIVGANSAAAMEFDVAEDAAQILSALRARPLIERAGIYRLDGSLLARYPAVESPAESALPPLGEDGHRFQSGRLVVYRPIILDNERIGTAYVEASIADINHRLRQYAGIAFLILIGSCGIAFLISSRLQGIISRPILDLARTASVVSAEQNYSIRVPSYYKDEVGTLICSFNEMLQQIEHREVTLQEVNEQLRVSESAALAANQAKSAFLARMSHELRTPLNAIIGYSEMLQEEAEDLGRDEFVPDLRKINGAGKHLLALINDILDLSKIEAGKMEVYLERLSVVGLVEDVVATIQPLVEKHHNRLVVECPESTGMINSDITKLRQILFNLLSNACKFTERGIIRLSVERRDTKEGESIFFSIADSGIGLSPSEIEKVFEAFMQADASTTRKHGGTGLGLAITRKFCEMMGGDIHVESQPGEGSTFTVRLPVEPAAAAASEAPPTPKPERAEPHETCILAIDDDPNTLELLERSLSRAGYRVRTARSGEEGLQLARELRPAAITLDVYMPQLDGWAVLSSLKADPELADIPVVMLTMLDSRNIGYALGASDYLTKPIDRDRLLSVLHKYRKQAAVPPVLIVEDDDDLRQLLRRMIAREGAEVAEARNGRAALEQVAAERPGLILLDLMMPEMDGFQFIHELRKREEWRDIPVVVLTARDLTEEDRRKLDGAVEKVLQKAAYTREDLLRTVRDLVTQAATEQAVNA